MNDFHHNVPLMIGQHYKFSAEKFAGLLVDGLLTEAISFAVLGHALEAIADRAVLVEALIERLYERDAAIRGAIVLWNEMVKHSAPEFCLLCREETDGWRLFHTHCDEITCGLVPIGFLRHSAEAEIVAGLCCGWKRFAGSILDPSALESFV